MMEQRRALTIPFAVDKDNLKVGLPPDTKLLSYCRLAAAVMPPYRMEIDGLFRLDVLQMESPFRIPMTCVSPESGKLEKQVSWTEFSGRKCRHDSRHRNGSILFGHNLASKFMLEMDRRKPRLILTDILKTEQGKAYLEKTKRKHTLRNRGQVSSNLKELSGCMESSLNCSETRSRPRVARNAKNSCSAKDSKRTSSSTPQRSGFRTRSQRNQDVDEEEKDMKEVMLGTEKDYRFAEVVDCGLSVSWEPADDKDSCDEFSPVCMKEKWTDPDEDLQDSLQKNKRKITRSQCNGTNSPKRFRESVLRLTRDDGRDGELVCSPDYLEEFREDPESLDRNILQFTVGGDPADVHVNVTSANLETGDFLGTCRQSLSSSQDNTTTTGHSEPIVLSSDDESCDITQHLSPVVHSIVAVEETLIQEEGAKPQEPSDIENMQMVPVAVEDLPPEAMSLFSKVEYNSMGVAFSAIYYGAHQGRSNGELLFKDQKIIIPLKDLSEQVDMVLTIGPNQLGRYSIWDQQDLETQAVQIKCDVEPVPPSILLLYVSASAAAVVQQNFVKVFGEHTEATDTDMVSQFILLTLQHPVEGMNGALLRSLLDIYCLNSIANDSFSSVDGLEDFGSPVLSLDDSIDLIKTTGLDSNLLSLLGLKDFDFELKTDQYSPHSDTERSVTPPIQPEDDSQPEAILEVETETEGVSSPPLKPEEDHKDQETEDPHEKRKEEPSPAYTICHRRTKASYCVSMCKPDASWTKYKHKGLAHRLIQFPPPPMKGGITVTMEDLQCLDSGQFLNDVIIDFYLKYLLHKASAAVTERSHIFSSFFYKQLTRRDNASEGNMKDSCQRQRRHQRVKTWTRHVDIFNKDFLFVPVNQEAHWYLVVICFPGLDEPTLEGRNDPNSQVVKILSRTGELQEQEATQGNESPNDNTETPQTPPLLNHNDHVDTETENTQESNKDSKPGPVSCTEQTFQKKIICKRPCILVMDSLKRSLHERVFKLLRDYLESEWEVRRGSSRDFNAEHMQSSHCKVPLQDNSSDCGLYLLQYVESFLKDPVVHFDLPLQLQRWFPRQQVRRKRDEIRNLVLNLYRRQNLDNNR